MEEGINFILDKYGVAHEIFEATMLFGSEIDREEFERWIQGEGGDLFTEYQEKLKKTHARICYSCKWFDQGKDQCFNGHLQYAQRKDCEGFEEYE